MYVYLCLAIPLQRKNDFRQDRNCPRIFFLHFVALANSYGIKGQKVSQKTDLKSALEELLNSDSAYLLEVKVAKEDNVFPMVPTGASVSEVRLQ